MSKLQMKFINMNSGHTCYVSALEIDFNNEYAKEFAREFAYHRAMDHRHFHFMGRIVWVQSSRVICDYLCSHRVISVEEIKKAFDEGKAIAKEEVNKADSRNGGEQ